MVVMVPMGTITIAVTKDDWQRLNARKAPGDGFADVVTRVLDRLEAAESEGYVPDRDDGRDVDPDEFDTFDQIERRAKEAEIADLKDETDAMETMGLPGEGDTLHGRKRTILDLYDYLIQHGEARKSEFLDVLESSPHGYQSPESAWSNLVKGKDTLHTLPGVVSPGEGGHTWKYDEAEL